MRARTVAAVAGVLLVPLLWWWLAPAPPAPPAAAPEPNHFAFVRSMDGTRPDGALQHDSRDQLVVDAELGYLFDYYLAGLGERDLAAIQAEIERELERRLKPEAAAQAKRLLASYLQYKHALAGAEAGLKPAATLLDGARARQQAMQELRKQYFTDAEIAGLFGATDAYDADALARLELAQDVSLDAATRKARTDALDAAMTPAQRAARDAPTSVLRLEESVQQLRAQGAGDNEVYAARAAALSPAAAARLADVDREEAQWKQRIASYQAARGQLAPASPEQLQQLQQLRDSLFTPQEQKRLGAYEQ